MLPRESNRATVGAGRMELGFGVSGRKSNRVAPWSNVDPHLIVSGWDLNEQDLCAWRGFLSINNASLDHIEITLPEYVLLGGGYVQIRGQSGGHVLKFERFFMPIRWLRLSLLLVRVKDLVEKLPKSRRYRLRPQGYSICLVFLKLFERVYAPLTAGLLQPYRPDSKLQDHKRTQLDRLYQKIVDDLDELLHAVGLKAA
jgi:hypothetical protein